MKKLIGLVFLISFSAHAEISSISHINYPENNMQTAEVFLSSGRVYEIDSNNSKLLKKLKLAKETRAQVELTIEKGPLAPDALEKIEDVTILEMNLQLQTENILSHLSNLNDEVDPMTNFTPSNVESLSLATKMFHHLINRTKTWSQCFNRAHIWARQLAKDYGVKSQKILIYYTQRYRREVDKKWWFHIAPMISVNGEKYVLDREFTNKPYTALAWEKIFRGKMLAKGVGPKNYQCKLIRNIKEYYDSANTNYEYCNIQYTSMYYWEPNDMEALDAKGIQKTQWVDWEIRAAAKEAFRGWRDVYKTYGL